MRGLRTEFSVMIYHYYYAPSINTNKRATAPVLGLLVDNRLLNSLHIEHMN